MLTDLAPGSQLCAHSEHGLIVNLHGILRPMFRFIDNSYGILSASVTLIVNSQHVYKANLGNQFRALERRKLILSGCGLLLL